MEEEKPIPLSCAARMLKIYPSTLCYWIKKLNVRKAEPIPFGRTREIIMLYKSSIEQIKQARINSSVLQNRLKNKGNKEAKRCDE